MTTGPRILHLDVETAPNIAHVWGLFNVNVGIKQIIDSSYVMCWSAKFHREKDMYFSSNFRHPHEYMMEDLWHLLDEADAVVTYNGDKFDLPTINKEFLLLGWTPPSPYKTIDLYKVVRKQFRFPSKKLDYVASALGLGNKVKHEGHELWIACMNGDEKAWLRMERYNKGDVRLLERLYKHLLPWIKDHPNYGLYVDPTRPTCPNCGGAVQSRGVQPTKTMKYRRYQCTKCGTWCRGKQTVSTPDDKANTLVQS